MFNFTSLSNHLGKNKEIEVRFNNITSGIFYRIKNHYNLVNFVSSVDEYYTSNSNRNSRVRKTTLADNSVQIIQKTLNNTNDFPYSFRLSVAEEKPFNLTPEYKVENTRNKKRWTFNNRLSKMELTEVNTTYNNGAIITSWEIELELVELPNINNNDLLKAFVADTEKLLKLIFCGHPTKSNSLGEMGG